MKTSTISLLFLAFVSISCNDDVDIDNTMDQEPLTNTLTVSIDQNEALNFEFDECNFDLFGDQRPLGSSGSIGINAEQWNTKTLHTQLNASNNSIGIKTIFLEQQTASSDQEIAFEEIKSILQSDLNDKTNPRFAFEVALFYEEKNYVSTQRNPMFIGSNNAFNYYDFNFDISANSGYDSECNDEELIQLSGSFGGWLINISNGEASDSIFINESTFDILLISS